MKFRIHIKADFEGQVKEELRDVAEIITGLRESSKKWQAHFGYANKKEKERWEHKADTWIDKHKVFYDDNN